MPKQNIFISHAGDDKPIVSLLERYLKRNWFTNLVEVFATSLPGHVEPGKWFPQIREQLAKSTVYIALITPTSINRRWIWWELGVGWDLFEAGKMLVIPLCYQYPISKIPEPLSQPQAYLLDQPENLKGCLDKLAQKFEAQQISTKSVKTFVSSLSKIELKQPNDDYSARLIQALEMLAEQNLIRARDLSIFESLNLVSPAKVQELQKIARKAANPGNSS